MPYHEGDIIGGRYRIHRQIGSGGLGSVYLAIDMRLADRFVTIKTTPNQSGHEQMLWRRENLPLAGLDHPNIVKVFDFGVDKDNLFQVTEYAPLGTLAQRYPRGTIVPLDKVVIYASQLASALQYAHDRGIIHRDVKPENMFLANEDKVLLGDFGLAVFTHASSSVEIVGTPLYMAPEQLLEPVVVPASDQYALAVVVYEWLTGDAPFSGGSPMDIMVRKLHESPPSLRSKNPTIPPDVDQIVMIALAKDPKDRFRSVQAFATALEEASRSNLSPKSPIAFPGSAVQPPSIYPSPSQSRLPPLAQGFMSQQGQPQYSPPAQEQGKAHQRPGQAKASRGLTQSLRNLFVRRGGRKRISPATPPPTELSLHAIARADIEENNRAFVGKMYTVQAGISQHALEGFSGGSFRVSVPDPQQPLLFDILIHADGSLALSGEWRYRLRYDPRNSEPQFITCPFQARETGKGLLIISFYRERQWLQTIRLEVEGVVQQQANIVRTAY